MTISIIIPVYNSEKYLERCIDSVLAQSFSDFELVLINDGSTDRSGVICDEYAEKDMRVVVFHKKNEGVSKARNLGLLHAKGDYVTFIDSDDAIDSDFLSDFFTVNTKEKSPDLYIQGYKKIYEGRKAIETTRFLQEGYYETKEEVYSFLCIGVEKFLLNYAISKLYKRELLRKHNILFDSSFSLGEDHLFVLTFLQIVNSVCVSKSAGYNYFFAFNPDSLTSRPLNIQQFYLYSKVAYEQYAPKLVSRFADQREPLLSIYQKKQNESILMIIKSLVKNRSDLKCLEKSNMISFYVKEIKGRPSDMDISSQLVILFSKFPKPLNYLSLRFSLLLAYKFM